MSEQVKKINFSALKNNNANIINEKKMTSSPESIKQETTSSGIKQKIQISLGKKKNILKKGETAIKETIKKENNIVENENNIEKDKNNPEIIKNEDISKDKKTIKKEEIIVENENNIEKDKNNPKIIKTEDISKDKKTIKKEEIIVENENNIEKDKNNPEIKSGNDTLLKEPENLFNNYESDFTVKQDSIIERIKKLKDLPKTRPVLVYSMLGFLILGISGLVFISPNDSYLKASVLGVEQEKTIVEENLSEIAKQKALKLKNKLEKEKNIKRKKEKLEDFLLNKNKKPNKIPEKINNIKNKSKEKKLKELLLESRKTK